MSRLQAEGSQYGQRHRSADEATAVGASPAFVEVTARTKVTGAVYHPCSYMLLALSLTRVCAQARQEDEGGISGAHSPAEWTVSQWLSPSYMRPTLFGIPPTYTKDTGAVCTHAHACSCPSLSHSCLCRKGRKGRKATMASVVHTAPELGPSRNGSPDPDPMCGRPSSVPMQSFDTTAHICTRRAFEAGSGSLEAQLIFL